MTKKLSLAVFVLAIAMAVPASAQRIGYIPQTPEGWYYKIQGNQVQMLAADNLGMVRGLGNQLRRSEIRSLADDLRWNGSAYGIDTDRGFYPMYDRNMRPMGRREATITGAAIGAAIGYGVSGNGRGTAIGGAAGAIVGLLTRRGKNQNQRDDVIVTPPPSGRESMRQGGSGGPIGSSPTSTSNSSSTGEWRVTNRTSKRAELWDGDRFVALIEPWQNVRVGVPQDSYKAVLLIPNRSGGMDQETAHIRTSANFNGWDIVAPAVR
ncbi:MAG TPA: hypothetical protein VJC06_00855 [Candidatus Paceibacterota bacterium]